MASASVKSETDDADVVRQRLQEDAEALAKAHAKVSIKEAPIRIGSVGRRI